VKPMTTYGEHEVPSTCLEGAQSAERYGERSQLQLEPQVLDHVDLALVRSRAVMGIMWLVCSCASGAVTAIAFTRPAGVDVRP